MPIRKAKWTHTKVYRPDGMKYAYAECMWPMDVELMQKLSSPIVVGFAPDAAMKNALVAFAREFGRWPNPAKMVFEITCDSVGVKATVMEVE